MTETLPFRATGVFVPRVAIACPTYDNRVHMPTAVAIDAAARPGGRVEMVAKIPTMASLLAHGFNNAISIALDLRDGLNPNPGGPPVPDEARPTHFVMIHSDIAPLGLGWADTLFDLLDRTGAELVSVVAPIKEPECVRTSTAIGSRDDPWARPRFVTADDRGRTPPTFGPADVCGEGEVLLVNTGLWMADLRCPWWDEFPGFQISDRISRDEHGRRRAQTRPEDWEFSRFLDHVGARYAATWEVPLAHHGENRWFNFGEEG